MFKYITNRLERLEDDQLIITDFTLHIQTNFSYNFNIVVREKIFYESVFDND